MVLLKFIGTPRWRRWKKLLAEAGVSYGKVGNRGRLLTHEECRRILTVWYRDLGEWRQRSSA